MKRLFNVALIPTFFVLVLGCQKPPADEPPPPEEPRFVFPNGAPMYCSQKSAAIDDNTLILETDFEMPHDYTIFKTVDCEGKTLKEKERPGEKNATFEFSAIQLEKFVREGHSPRSWHFYNRVSCGYYSEHFTDDKKVFNLRLTSSPNVLFTPPHVRVKAGLNQIEYQAWGCSGYSEQSKKCEETEYTLLEQGTLMLNVREVRREKTVIKKQCE